MSINESDTKYEESKTGGDKQKVKLSMPIKPEGNKGEKYDVDPGTSTVKRVENLSNFEELYTILCAGKRKRTMEEFGVSPIMPIRSDVEKEEKINLQQKDAQLISSLSINDGCDSQSTFISKAVIREAEKVSLQDKEKYLWVEVFQNNMYLAVTRSTGNKNNPFVVNFLHYERTYVPGDDIMNSDIFNGIAIGIQEYINLSYIEEEFEEQGSIPIVLCFSDYVEVPSLIEWIANRVGHMSTFNAEIVRKNYSKEFAETLQLIITDKTIEFTTIVPIYSGNFMSFYCFDKFKEDKRPHANYDFLRGLGVQEFLECPKVKKQNLSGTNLDRIYPDSVLKGEGSNVVLVSTSFYLIGQYKGFQRDIVYKFLTKFERFNFDTNATLGIDLFSQLASPLRQAIHLQNYIRNHPLFLISPQLEEEPVVNMERFEYFLQDEYKDKGSILHPYTFELIGTDINRFCKFVMKRCLSFSALAVLATIEKKYYEDIEPKYKSGSTPKVIISIREDDRGLTNGFEKTIVEYLDNGASLFWNQRRKDLESPKFEIISDFDSSIIGSHILTKYLRTLIPHDYWIQNATEFDKKKLEERKKSYRIALDASRYSRKQEDDLVKQLINNISGMDSFEEIDLSTIKNTGQIKSSLEKMCGIADMGKIESITINSATNRNQSAQNNHIGDSQRQNLANIGNQPLADITIPDVKDRPKKYGANNSDNLKKLYDVLGIQNEIKSNVKISKQIDPTSKMRERLEKLRDSLYHDEQCPDADKIGSMAIDRALKFIEIKKQNANRKSKPEIIEQIITKKQLNSARNKIHSINSMELFFGENKISMIFDAICTICSFCLQEIKSVEDAISVISLQDLIDESRMKKKIKADDIIHLLKSSETVFADFIARTRQENEKKGKEYKLELEVKGGPFQSNIEYAKCIMREIGDIESLDEKYISLVLKIFPFFVENFYRTEDDVDQAFDAMTDCRDIENLKFKRPSDVIRLIKYFRAVLGDLESSYCVEKLNSIEYMNTKDNNTDEKCITEFNEFNQAKSFLYNMKSLTKKNIPKVVETHRVFCAYNIKHAKNSYERILGMAAKFDMDELRFREEIQCHQVFKIIERYTRELERKTNLEKFLALSSNDAESKKQSQSRRKGKPTNSNTAADTKKRNKKGIKR